MALLRRGHLWRKLLVATLALACALALLQWSRRRARYVPGERTQGIVDVLGDKAAPQGVPALRFSDVTEQAGLAFRHFPATRTNTLPEDMGSGVALGDVDGDGWCDVFLVNEAHALGGRPPDSGAGRCALYRNRGDGTFADVSPQSGIDWQGLGMAAALLDSDSDGDLDLLISAYRELRLYRNEGSLRFVDVTAQAGLAGLEGFWTGLAVGDYDRDGAVDAYVCGYVVYLEDVQGSTSQYDVDIPASINPSAFEPERNLLLRNRGDGGFEERAAAAGVDNPTGRSLSAVFADLDGDGWLDVYVANDVSDNALFLNRGDGTFADATTQAQVGDYRGAMGLAVGDFDRDQQLDFFVTHWVAQENALYQNRSQPRATSGEPGHPLFMDVADRFGLGHVALDRVGWATRFLDLDNDGWLDLFVVNGHTIPTSGDPTRLTPMRSQLFWNLSGRRGYQEVGGALGDFFRELHVGRGGATFDYDLDGDEDLLVTLHGEGARLLRNDGGNAGRVLRVRLRQPTGNRFALGARLRIEVGGVTLVDQLDTQGSYLSQHAVGELAFGLGEAGEAELLAVTWPDGGTDEVGPLAADRLVTWVRGAAPRVEPLPGRRGELAAGPASVGDRRAFFDLLSQAGHLRLAGEYQQAHECYARALALWPGHEDALYYTGNCRLELGDREGAIAAFEQLVTVNRASSRGWLQIGQCVLAGPERGEVELARAHAAFRRAHEINGEETLPVVKLGLVALLRDDLEDADRWFADAVRTNPGSVEALYWRGRIAWLRGDRERAQELLAQAHEAATRAPPGAKSVADEGTTRGGKAMLSAIAASRPASDLDRWKTLLERSPDAESEYAAGER